MLALWECAERYLSRRVATQGAWDLALFAARDGLEPGLHHTVFEITDEAALAAAERKASAGGTGIELILDRPDKRSVFVRDPDGMRFEFRCARPSAESPMPSPLGSRWRPCSWQSRTGGRRVSSSSRS